MFHRVSFRKSWLQRVAQRAGPKKLRFLPWPMPGCSSSGAQPACRLAGAALRLEPRGVREVEPRAGRQVEAQEPQTAAELGVEPRGAGEMAARAGPPEAAGKVEARDAGEAARQASGTLPAVAPAPAAWPSGVQWPVEGCHSIRRICFLGERTCDTSGTLPGEPPVGLGRVKLARTALRAPVESPRFAAFHNART